ncbi:MAG TPA: hypothetical protein VGL80_21495 [Pseudonocardiaceae bacterium]
MLSVIAGGIALFWPGITVLALTHPLAGALGIAIVIGTYSLLYTLLITLGAWLRQEVRHPVIS